MWLVIGGGMLTLLIAAMGRQKKDQCRDYKITLKATGADELFLNETAVAKLLKAAVNGNIKGQPKSSFNLQKMEQLLEDNIWVKDAELYFDNKNVLHISVIEREPVARVFTVSGRSFYIDEKNVMLPLSDRVSAKVPVFTGFPDKKVLGTKDSLLLNDIGTTAQFITGNAFWTAQVSQMDIVSCGTGCWDFEMVPLVGNHIVKLGNGGDMEKKFQRLLVFYQQVLSKAGFDKYKSIDVQYEGQVVAAKSENPKVDSVQFRRNVMQMLKQAREMQQADESEENETASPVITTEGVKETAQKEDKKTEDRAKPAPVKKAKDNKRTPKAVMPQKDKD